MSQLPLISFFMNALTIIAPEFFDHGGSSLEAACRDMNKWPPPVANQQISVSIFGTELQVSDYKVKIVSIFFFGLGRTPVPARAASSGRLRCRCLPLFCIATAARAAFVGTRSHWRAVGRDGEPAADLQ